MFSRRRANSNPPAKAQPTAAALTAAGQAFLANRASNANLSNAAAAAALRSHTTTPTPVGEIQTRRMAQRRSSVSSNGSSRPGGLQRRDSGGSMTERTFRDPSPSRHTSSGYRADDVPPVPALPKGYMSPPPLPNKSNQRPASVEPPERVLSPPPLPGGRGVSLDRGPGVMPSRLKPRMQGKSPKLSSSGEPDGTRNRDSTNFSRPMSPMSSPPTSPIYDRRTAPPHPQAPQQQKSNAANVGRLRDGESENIQYALQTTAQAPVKRKKKKPTKNTEGSYLASGGSGGRAVGTSIVSTPQRQIASTESTPSPENPKLQTSNHEIALRSRPKKKTKKSSIATNADFQRDELAYGSYTSDSDSAVSDNSNLADRYRNYNTRAAGLLAKQPSIVREDREAEEQEDFRRSTNRTGKPVENGNVIKSKAAMSSKIPVSEKASARSMSSTNHVPTPSEVMSLHVPHSDRGNVNGGSSSGTQPARQKSLSPARAAHFSAQPVLETPDNLKHQPPARSISPVKSALKHSPSRGPSPVAGSTSAAGSRRRGPASEASDTTSMISDDGIKAVPKRKKSARVSFDNESVVVGRAATPPTDADSPLIMSPQNKNTSTSKWLGLGKEESEDPTSSAQRKEQDIMIQPTPALPSFDSVRGRDQKETVDQTQAVPEKYMTADSLNTSSDQRIGNILSRVFDSESPTQNPAISTSNEPLPPEVTSVEGTGYHSDTETSVDDGHASEPKVSATNVANTPYQVEVARATEKYQTEASSNANTVLVSEQQAAQTAPKDAEQAGTIILAPPSIAIQPATPGLDENQKSREQYWFDMPGGFPTSSEDSTNEPPPNTTLADQNQTISTFKTASVAEPNPETIANQGISETPAIAGKKEKLRTHTPPEASEESDDTNNSIYSDAAEDLSDTEGDGFGSINAIVESPVSPGAEFANRKRSESPSDRASKSTALRPSPLDRNQSELSEPGPEAGWDRAQAYWSGLSQSRKQEIERAAAQGDQPEESTEIRPRTKKNRTVPKKAAQQAPPAEQDEGYRGENEVLPSKKLSGMAKAPALKSSMRKTPIEPPKEPQMRSSMRGSIPVKSSIRASMPPQVTSEPRRILPQKDRPLSAEYTSPAKASFNGHDRSSSLGNARKSAMPGSTSITKPKPSSSQPVRRTMSNGSDSSSSFKKARSKTSDSGRYTMRRSMRGSSADERPPSIHGRAPLTTARGSSPPDASRKPFSSGPGMRSSMRGSIESSKPNRTKSPSRFPGFGKSSKPKPTAKGPTSRFSSRFADSSDEDDTPRNRRSRFADSSDEDEPTRLTPVRGIPRHNDEGDSTDLEDSSADENAVSGSAKIKALQPSKPEGAALGIGSLRAIPEASDSANRPMGTGFFAQRNAEKEKKKRSFFGSLGSKKVPKSEPLALPIPNYSPQQDTISTPQGQGLGISTPDAPASPSSTKQQRLLGPSSPIADTNNPLAAPKSPKSPKLQRRISAQQAEKIQMKRGMSDTRPSPQSPAGTSTPTMRPTTSDGTQKTKNGPLGRSGLSNEVRAGRPDLGGRTNTVETTATGGTGTVKKKSWFKKTFGRGKS